jgi:hypothetical protein
MPKNDGKTPEQRFHESYVVDPRTKCWNWTRGINGRGYAYIWVPNGTWKGRTIQAYKFGYELKYGRVPKGNELDHLCRNTICVNWDHVEPVTRRENQLRGETIAGINSRKTQCPRGHPYDMVNSLGRRGCRRCARVAASNSYYAHHIRNKRRAKILARRRRRDAVLAGHPQ